MEFATHPPGQLTRRQRPATPRIMTGLVATLMAALTLASAARAQPTTYNQPFRLPDGPAANRMPVVQPALQLADRVWRPGLAREGCPILSVSSDPLTTTAPSAGEGAVGDIAGWATPGDCTIHLHRHALWLGGPELCETVLHEAGHVSGYHNPNGPRMPDGTRDTAHSPNPHSIMYPSQFVLRGVGILHLKHRTVWRVAWSGVDRRCLRAYGAHGD